MKLIVYIHQDSFTKGVVLKKVIEQNYEGFGIQIIQTFNAFKARLKKASNYNQEIFILLADSKNRLIELTSLIDLLESKRIFLILPDDSKATLSQAHKFFPRYFTYVNDTYADLCAVITKMTNKEKIKI